MPPDSLSASDLKKAMVRFRDVLLEHQQELNELNVYPVPDGDSGTNLRLTADAVVDRLEGAHDMVSVCRAVSQGALQGARGNSGVILSQFLHGMAKTLTTRERFSGIDLAAAIRAGSDAAYEAVSRPVEGTILTVAREAAEAAEAVITSRPEPDVPVVLEAAVHRAEDALSRTPDMLSELEQAGVVDSGGKGVVLLLETLLAEADGRPVPGPQVVRLRSRPVLGAHGEGPRFEVMLFLRGDHFGATSLKGGWSDLGDSIIVAGEEGLYNCHIHTDHVGRVVESALIAGRPSGFRITDLARHRGGVGGPGGGACNSVVLVETEPIRVLFEGLGADVVLNATRLSSGDLAGVIEGLDADSVVVIPNAERNIPLADAASSTNVDCVVVLATRTATQGLSAMMVFDPNSSACENAAAMTEAVSRTRPGRVIATGKGFEAFDRDERVGSGPRIEAVAIDLLDRLIDTHTEVVTVLTGPGMTPETMSSIGAHFSSVYPHVVVEAHDGGGPEALLFGAE